MTRLYCSKCNIEFPEKDECGDVRDCCILCGNKKLYERYKW